MPDKEEKKKGMDQFCVGEENDVGAREDVLFQNTGTTIQMFKFGCEFSLLISPLPLYINAGHILEFICTCFFSLYSWLSWLGW